MFGITNPLDWTNVNSSQPVSQIAAKLGSSSDCCGLHSCGRFWTRWWTVWVVPTILCIFSPNPLVIRKHLGWISSVVFGHAWPSHMKRKVFQWSISASACQHAIINFVYWNISLWIQSYSLVVFLLSASWCFDIGVLLKETNLLPASGQDGCVESHSPDQIPHGPCATGPFWSLCSPLPAFPLSPPLPLPGTIPPRAAGNPLVCWKASFTGTQQPFQTDMWFWPSVNTTSISIFSGAAKMTTDWFRGKEILWREKRLCLENSGHASVD